MTKEELCKQYADKKTIDCHNSRFGLSNHDLYVKKSYDLFTGYDIEQAYEDGFDKAVELVCRFFYERNYSSKFIKNFKEIMEEGV